MSMLQCRAATKKGSRCQIEARPSGLCHTHDPEVRCRVINAKGRPCVIASGGGPCERHQGGQQAPVEQALKDVPLYEPTGAESLFACAPAQAPVVVRPEPREEPPVARLTYAFVERTFNFT
ncbi:DUF5763 domain-containing protein [Streptomyces avidinii]|uniref:Uncharacterized protein n=1 Tax=Streptomyces avidinii TaxID=1895 RepID=A0ABS4L6J9_STRAV|nr:DUF5763 domain-containing protein [Streptomyces avidinii]MBP2037707.1 hypothetical protein [Streptomyces avidinii]